MHLRNKIHFSSRCKTKPIHISIFFNFFYFINKKFYYKYMVINYNIFNTPNLIVGIKTLLGDVRVLL